MNIMAIFGSLEVHYSKVMYQYMKKKKKKKKKKKIYNLILI
jgi:hypothetical protein